MIIDKSRVESIVSIFVTVYPHEISALISSASSFFFILSAYFVVLPLRDEGAISLGLENLPVLFVGSLCLTLVAAPVSTLIFSRPNLSKGKALVLIHRFFSLSLVLFFILWVLSTPDNSSVNTKETDRVNSIVKHELKLAVNQTASASSDVWKTHGWLYIVVRISMFLWVALLNLITISSTWARVIDVTDSESGSRLFGFIGAGATLGQLFGSLFATGMAWLGPYLLLFSALLLEFAAQSSKGIHKEIPQHPEELTPIRKSDPDHTNGDDGQNETSIKTSSPRTTGKHQIWVIFEGLQLILSSSYLLQVALFLWLSAVISSFFYFQKVTIIADAVASPVGRRKLFAQINSVIAVFILSGQLTLTGRILTTAGVTIAICSLPFVGFLNLVALAVWPSWIAVAISETLRKVVMYVVARPGRELLFTVVTQDEKYKAKVCIDVIVQRLGDASAAGLYKLLFSTLNGKASATSLFALPVCFVWIAVGFNLGRRQTQLATMRAASSRLAGS
ncbi:uncharacterized protein LOC127259631 isoform X2 [Andrographis paniculata]|uniref:uncharacterized protein LOC127259631 isoform X2 n=1 Tax=Andrographis paniculata TaxID=175694 RepID=UPI0021E8AAA1|nr:uncharacterized protein LOC127259631 isoform X2 [Andrographis paniculata]